MKPTPVTPLKVAVSQLRLAITLFLEEREYIAVITLAGAAEEILGKLAASAGHTPALARSVGSVRHLHLKLWGADPGAKAVMALRNKTRNELKHLVEAPSSQLNLPAEAIRMLNRAVENYRLVHVRAAAFVRDYERRREHMRREARDA